MKTSAARKRILDVASRLFYKQGYHSTGINQIIDEAEIARGSLYNHFPSKRDLLSAYITKAEQNWFDELNEYLLPVKDPGKKILALFDYRILRQVRNNFGGCQFIKIGSELPSEDLAAFELVRVQKTRFKKMIADLLSQVNARKNNRLSPAMLADTLFLLLEGATVEATLYKSAEGLKKAKEIARTLIK